MCQQLIFILCCAGLLTYGSTRELPKIVGKKDIREKSLSWPPSYDATAFDYDYGIQRTTMRPWHYQKSDPATTERPLIRYWNNFVRNIRLPVPTITWNMTNPLLNLFNAGGTNIIESPVPSYETNVKRRRQNQRRQSNILVKRTKKRKQPATIEANDAYLQSYTENFDPNKPLYLYDANSGQYYEMQRFDTYNEQNEEQEADAEADADAEAEVEVPSASSTEVDVDNNNDENELNSAEISDASSSDEAKDFDVDKPSTKETAIANVPLLHQTGNEQISDVSAQNANNIRKSLRNIYGSYMSDDRMNRKRQRASPKRKPAVRDTSKFKSQNQLRYYFLQSI